MQVTTGGSSLTDVEGAVFEIFQQKQPNAPLIHGGNLRAPDPELAIHYAKEFYGRRQESMKLWVVPRAAVWEIIETALPYLPVPAQSEVEPPGNQVFALFGQKIAGEPLEWILDLEAPSYARAVEEALQAAHAIEPPLLRLWICPRELIAEVTNPDLLQPPLDRSYRRLDGYNIREKLRAARQRVQSQTAQLDPEKKSV